MKKAMMKIKASLTKNVGIKVIAVIIAALIWLTVVNISDPEKTVVIYNIPVAVTHEKVITDMNMVYDVNEEAKVNITVSGKRSVVTKLSADDFRATASLKELSKVNSVPIEIVARQNSIGRKVTIEKQSLQTLEVGVEEIKKQTFMIEVEYSGNPAEGYVTGEYTLSKKKVTVEAPESVIDRIDHVIAQCDIDGETDDFTKKCDIDLYDKHGAKIKADHVVMSAKNVKVSVVILKEKKVPIVVNSVGSPRNGYHVENVVISPEKVLLVGKKEKLDTVETITVSDTIDISDKTEDTIETIDLRKYLPDGVYISGKNTVDVKIEINKLVTKKLSINTDKIQVENLNNDYELTFVSKSVSVELQGEERNMSNISADAIVASVNLKNYKEGTKTVDVIVAAPEGTVVLNKVSVRVKIKKKK